MWLAAAGPAAAAPAEPWRAAAEVRDGLFDAQSALLLDERGADRHVEHAADAYAGPLRTVLRRADPAAHREILGGLRRAARAETPIALAAVRGTVQAALFRGALAATLAAIERRDVPAARSWLLLREFRTPTRYTRPGADATLALRALERRRTSTGAARLAVVKDVLDATQGRARERVDELARLGERGFATRRAEVAAQLAGAWKMLAPRYGRERGPLAARAATRAFAQLRRAALASDEAGVERLQKAVAAALSSFTAAPLTDTEQARRANQLLRFVALIAVEYDHGVEDGRVTIPFEIQEGLAFSKAARAAFMDLQGTLTQLDRRATVASAERLGALDSILRSAQVRPRPVPSVNDVKARVEALEEQLGAVFPDEWEKASDEGDFDLIQISLDRLEQQVAAGQYRQAEQTRIELYAILEFGPERRLVVFDPGLVASLEGLIWFGHDGRPGLAELVSGRAPRKEYARRASFSTRSSKRRPRRLATVRPRPRSSPTRRSSSSARASKRC